MTIKFGECVYNNHHEKNKNHFPNQQIYTHMYNKSDVISFVRLQSGHYNKHSRNSYFPHNLLCSDHKPAMLKENNTKKLFLKRKQDN